MLINRIDRKWFLLIFLRFVFTWCINEREMRKIFKRCFTKIILNTYTRIHNRNQRACTSKYKCTSKYICVCVCYFSWNVRHAISCQLIKDVTCAINWDIFLYPCFLYNELVSDITLMNTAFVGWKNKHLTSPRIYLWI